MNFEYLVRVQGAVASVLVVLIVSVSVVIVSIMAPPPPPLDPVEKCLTSLSYMNTEACVEVLRRQ